MKLLSDFDGVWTSPGAEGLAHGVELDEALLAVAEPRDRDVVRERIAAARRAVRAAPTRWGRTSCGPQVRARRGGGRGARGGKPAGGCGAARLRARALRGGSGCGGGRRVLARPRAAARDEAPRSGVAIGPALLARPTLHAGADAPRARPPRSGGARTGGRARGGGGTRRGGGGRGQASDRGPGRGRGGVPGRGRPGGPGGAPPRRGTCPRHQRGRSGGARGG